MPYEPMDPQTAAIELGVPLTERMQPDMRNHLTKRLVSREESVARGWSWFRDGVTVCRYGHAGAARRTSNPRICADCERVREGLEPIAGKSTAQKFYSPERVAKAQAAKAPVPAALVAQVPVKPLEPNKKEMDFLSALAELGDFDAAAKRVGQSRGQIEARASVDATFKAALTDLCERHGIAWTRAPDPVEFQWSPEIERQLVKRYVDTGLLETARNELGIAASDYQQHLQDSPRFAEMVEGARSAARETLRERATALADRGKPELLKYLSDEAAQSDGEFVTVAGGQRVRRSDPEADRAFLAGVLAGVKKNLDAQDRLRAACIARVAEQQKPIVAEPDDLTEDLT